MRNLYFDLTCELNEEGPVAVLASGQAVVFYRICDLAERLLPQDPQPIGDPDHGTAE